MERFVNVFFYFFLLHSIFCFSQENTLEVITFDFNNHEIKEKNNKVISRAEGVSLTQDRFGNNQSAIYIHGHPTSYLNLGTSKLLKPKEGTISLWVSLDRRVYSGKGYDNNPILITKNGPSDDFNCAYLISYECYNNRFCAFSTKDSTKEVIISSIDEVLFNNWYHLVITSNKDYFTFYINGKKQGQFKKGFETVFLESDSVVIGHSASVKNERYTQGVFDDIQIFNKVLNDDEILDLYNAPNPSQFKNILYEFLKYGIIIFLLVGIIIYLINRNKRNLVKQKEKHDLFNRVLELELKVVKAQMNPHFISNCLAAIQELIYKKEIDKAGQYLAKFSFFLRQVLNYSDSEFITMKQELDIVNLTVELEQLRFKNEFDYILKIDNAINIEEVSIPSLITQPFIENSIWHGLLPLHNIRKPQLSINIFLKNDLPIIEIEDNGVGRNKGNINNMDSKGIRLVLDKIESLNRLYNTSNYKVEIVDILSEENIPQGTKIIIQLDWIRE